MNRLKKYFKEKYKKINFELSNKTKIFLEEYDEKHYKFSSLFGEDFFLRAFDDEIKNYYKTHIKTKREKHFRPLATLAKVEEN